MKSHRDAEDRARDPRKLIAQLGTTGDELARTLGLDKGRVRQRGVNSVVASGLHFQAAFGVICSG